MKVWGFAITEGPLSGERGDTESEIMISNGEWEFYTSLVNMTDKQYNELETIISKLNNNNYA